MNHNNFTTEQWEKLNALLAVEPIIYQASDGVHGLVSIQDILSRFNSGFFDNWAHVEPEISAGVITVTRQAKVTILHVNTEASAATDDLITIDDPAGATGTSAFANDDILLVCQLSEARTINILQDPAGNLLLPGGAKTLDGPGEFMKFRRWNGKWYGFTGWPGDVTATLTGLAFTPEDRVISAGAITISGSYARVTGAPTGETRASGTIQINATAGSAGVLSVYSDEGFGTFLLGSTSYTAPTTPLIQVTALTAAINTLTATHGYTAVDDGVDLCRITCPVGTGVSGNAFIMSDSATGGFTTTIVQFGVVVAGVDGTYVTTQLDTINGASVGKVLYLENTMTTGANIELITGGNIGVPYAVIAPGKIVKFLYTGSTWIAVQIGVWVDDRNVFKNAQPTAVWNGVTVGAGGSTSHAPSDADYSYTFNAGSADGIYFISAIPKNYIYGISPKCDFFWRTDGVSVIAMGQCAIGHLLCAEGSVSPAGAAFSWTNFGLTPDGTANRIRVSTEFTFSQILPYPPAVAPATVVRGYYRVAFYRNSDGGQGGDTNPDILYIPDNLITVRYPVWTESI